MSRHFRFPHHMLTPVKAMGYLMHWVKRFSFVAALLLSANTYGASLNSADFPSLISTLNTVGPIMFCGEKVPADIQEVWERLEKELMLTVWNRSQALLWLKRSKRYLPHIEKMLKENNMPDDLKYVAIAESALRAHAGSSKGAIGFWQFLTTTGRKYGLVINKRLDERRNIFFSTRAAILYFKELYEKFGSWTLVVAAYNMGEKGLEAEILEQGIDDYYQLYLSLETQRYIFRILAVKIIFSDPARYGFILTRADFYPPLSFDTITVASSQEIPIRIIAQAAETYFKTIKDLNPEVRGHFYSRGEHRVRIPKGASKGFQSRFQELRKTHASAKRGSVYIIQEGDNLSSIAHEFDIPLAALIIWNRIDLKKSIYPGQRLIIYSKGILRGGPGRHKSSPGNQTNPAGSKK